MEHIKQDMRHFHLPCGTTKYPKCLANSPADLNQEEPSPRVNRTAQDNQISYLW